MTRRHRRHMERQMKKIERRKKAVSKTEKALLGVILFAIDFVLTGYVTCYIWNTVVTSFLRRGSHGPRGLKL